MSDPSLTMSSDEKARLAARRTVDWAAKASRLTGGWCSEEQGRQLYALAAASDSRGHALEVGTFKGKSATWIVAGLSQRTDPGLLHCVDAFLGEDPIGCLGQRRCVDQCRCDPHNRQRGPTYDAFRNHVNRIGIRDRLCVHRAWSLDAAAAYGRDPAGCIGPALSLLYIDGGHRYAEVRGDYDAWLPQVRVGGTVGFDDSVNHRSVARLMTEMDDDPRVRREGTVDNLTWWTKVAS